MCDPVAQTDSRYRMAPIGGWYCCRDNTFNKGRKCRICKKDRDQKETALVIPRLRRKSIG